MAISVTQVCQASNNTNGLTAPTYTTTAAIAAGSLVVLAFETETNSSWTTQGASAVTISSTSLTLVVAKGQSASAGCDLWYVENCPAIGSGATITVTMANSQTHYKSNLNCAYITGVKTSGSLDKTASASGSSTTPSATTATLSQANEVCVAALGMRGTGASYSEPSGWTKIGTTQIANDSNNAVNLAYQEVASTSAVTYAPTLSPSAAWANLIGTFAETATVIGNSNRLLLGVG